MTEEAGHKPDVEAPLPETTTPVVQNPQTEAPPLPETTSPVVQNPPTEAPPLPETRTPDVENSSTMVLLEKARLGLRAGACFFSLVSFVLMASNKNFDEYEEYRYLVAIGALAFLYTAAQVLRQLLHQYSAGREVMLKTIFLGDQVVAYLLMSALSAAIPMTNRKWERADNSFNELSAAAISMTFFAFVALAFSALISGFKLSNQFISR